MARARLGAALIAALAAAACSFAPPYHPPVVSTPVAYKEAGPWRPATPDAPALGDRWWTRYGDATLDRLEGQVATANPTFAGALARYDESSAYVRQAQAGALPTLSVAGDFSRDKQSANRPLRSPSQPTYYSADTIQAEFGYELDLWGRVRNAVAAGKAEATASADDLAAIRLSLEAQLAEEYMALRGSDRQILLLEQTVAAYAQANHVNLRRYQDGIASAIDTSRSGAQLAGAQAQLADVRAARALSEHAIASLVGVPASSFTIAPAAISFAVPAIPVGLPATLLQRRPDIAAAERRVAAANAGIGVAKAAFFPAITLGGTAGFQNTGLPGLLSAPNLLWSIGPSAVLNIIDGGRRRAELAVARARWSDAVASYRGTVLTAFQQVEDGLSQLHHLADEATAEAEAVRQAAITERLSLHRYDKGANSFLDVFTAQTTALRTREEALELETRRLQASIRLIRALGGGWSPGAALPANAASPSGPSPDRTPVRHAPVERPDIVG